MGKAHLTAGRAEDAALEAFNALGSSEAEAALLRCCGAARWARTMARLRPFHTRAALRDAASDVWRALTPDDWLQAFAAHPRIGARAPLSEWSAREQAGAAGADDDTLDELAALNAEYEARFGYIFIVRATGRDAGELLAELKRRIETKPADELRTAAAEQEEITRLRLEEFLTESGANG